MQIRHGDKFILKSILLPNTMNATNFNINLIKWNIQVFERYNLYVNLSILYYELGLSPYLPPPPLCRHLSHSPRRSYSPHDSMPLNDRAAASGSWYYCIDQIVRSGTHKNPIYTCRQRKICWNQIRKCAFPLFLFVCCRYRHHSHSRSWCSISMVDAHIISEITLRADQCLHGWQQWR